MIEEWKANARIKLPDGSIEPWRWSMAVAEAMLAEVDLGPMVIEAMTYRAMGYAGSVGGALVDLRVWNVDHISGDKSHG